MRSTLVLALRRESYLSGAIAFLNNSVVGSTNVIKRHVHGKPLRSSGLQQLRNYTKPTVDLDFYSTKLNEGKPKDRQRPTKHGPSKSSKPKPLTEGKRGRRVAESRSGESDLDDRIPSNTFRGRVQQYQRGAATFQTGGTRTHSLQKGARTLKPTKHVRKREFDWQTEGRSNSIGSLSGRRTNNLRLKRNVSEIFKTDSQNPISREFGLSLSEEAEVTGSLGRQISRPRSDLRGSRLPTLKAVNSDNSKSRRNDPKGVRVESEFESGARRQPRKGRSNQNQGETKQTFGIETNRLDLFVSCLPGLETLLSAELMALQIDHLAVPGGATLVSPTISEMMDCHLYLGTASHVLLRCGKPFEANGLAELRRKVSKTEWGSIFSESFDLDVRVSSFKSTLYHTGAVAERVKAGIYESLGLEIPEESDTNSNRADQTSPDGQPRRPIVPVSVRVNKDVVHISIDTSTTPLHQRGYRLQTAKAPLREDLAYAMLYSAGWQPTHSRVQYTKKYSGRLYSALLDPFCGSGTIAIEAAAIAAGFPPGRLRSAPMEGTKLHNPAKWDTLIKSALSPDQRGEDSEFFISASDRDAGAIQAVISNAKRAGVRDYISLTQGSLSSSEWFDNPSAAPESILVATNPPFGKRISPIGSDSRRRESHPLLPLYQKIGHEIRKLMECRPNVGAVVLAQDIRLARRTALEDFEVAFTSHHGGTPVAALVMGRTEWKRETLDLPKTL